MSSKWNIKRLDEVAYNATSRFDIKNKNQAIFINTGDVYKGEFLHHNFSPISEMPGQAKKKINNKDILYSEIRPGNKRYCYVDLLNPENYIVSTKFMIIRTKDEIVPEYLYLILTSSLCENEFKLIAESRSGTFPQITFDSISYYPIKYPDKFTQHKIISYIKSLDKKITLNNQINETLEAMAQAIFKSWFIDFEPVKAKIEAKEAGQDAEGILLAAMSAISGKEIEALKVLQTTAPEEYAELKAIAEQFPDSLEESELGMIPKGWEVRSFFNWIEPKRGKSITKKKVIPGNIPVVAGGLEPAYYHNEHNVIGPAITISASGANAGFINLYFENIWSSDSSYISSKETECIFTAYILLKLRQTDIFKMQTGAAQPHIYPKDFERLFFTYPGMSLFSQFEKYICSSFQKIGKNIQQNKTLTELRDTLLPKLLSGEIDVSNVEIDELLENEA